MRGHMLPSEAWGWRGQWGSLGGGVLRDGRPQQTPPPPRPATPAGIPLQELGCMSRDGRQRTWGCTVPLLAHHPLWLPFSSLLAFYPSLPLTSLGVVGWVQGPLKSWKGHLCPGRIGSAGRYGDTGGHRDCAGWRGKGSQPGGASHPTPGWAGPAGDSIRAWGGGWNRWERGQESQGPSGYCTPNGGSPPLISTLSPKHILFLPHCAPKHAVPITQCPCHTHCPHCLLFKPHTVLITHTVPPRHTVPTACCSNHTLSLSHNTVPFPHHLSLGTGQAAWLEGRARSWSRGSPSCVPCWLALSSLPCPVFTPLGLGSQLGLPVPVPTCNQASRTTQDPQFMGSLMKKDVVCGH